MKRQVPQHILRLSISIIVSGVLLWLLSRNIPLDSTLAALSDIRWRYLPVLMVVWSLPLLTRTLFWQALLSWRIRFLPTFYCINIGFLVNNTLPFRAGDITRAVLVAQTSPKVTTLGVLGSTVVERLLDILSVLLILAGVLLLLPVDAQVAFAGAILGLVALSALVMLFLMAYFPQPIERLFNGWQERIPLLRRFDLQTKFEQVMIGVNVLTTWRGVRDVLLWVSMTWGLSLLGAWTLLLVVPTVADVENILLAVSLALVAVSVSTIFPLTFANIGAFEAAVIFALATVGVERADALAFGLLWHAGILMMNALWGVFSLLVGQFSLRDFQQLE